MKRTIQPAPLMTDIVQQRRERLKNTSEITQVKAVSDLAIKEVRAWTLREPVSKRAYTVVKIQTGSGLVGYGECAPISPAEFAETKRIITGVTVNSFEIIAPSLKHIPTARAALNIAMLDVAGKVANAPIFQYLGGPTRFKVRALAHLSGNTDQELISSLNMLKGAGYMAFAVPVPAFVHRNQGQANVLATRKRLDTLREAGGEGMDFVLDGANKLTPGDAQMISNAIENFHVLWFNEPCSSVSLAAIKKLSAENVTPIGLGSHTTDSNEILDFLRDDAVDIIRPAIGLNGISQIRRMAVIAESYYVAAGPVHDGGPIGTAAALHLAASIPNFFIQQIPYPEAQEDRSMRAELTMAPIETVKEGYAALLTGPGLGITVNEKNLEKYKEATL
jgi:galactonate dehydratase